MNQATFSAFNPSVNLVKVKVIASGTSDSGVVNYLGAELKLYNYWPECIPSTIYCDNTNVAHDGLLGTNECIEVMESIMEDISNEYTVLANGTNGNTCQFRRIDNEAFGFDYRPLNEIMDIIEP